MIKKLSPTQGIDTPNFILGTEELSSSFFNNYYKATHRKKNLYTTEIGKNNNRAQKSPLSSRNSLIIERRRAH